MRTTLDIDEDVLAAAKELARRRHLSAGNKVVSNLLRKALSGKERGPSDTESGQPGVGGFRPFPPRGAIVTDGQIDALRDAEGV